MHEVERKLYGLLKRIAELEAELERARAIAGHLRRQLGEQVAGGYKPEKLVRRGRYYVLRQEDRQQIRREVWRRHQKRRGGKQK